MEYGFDECRVYNTLGRKMVENVQTHRLQTNLKALFKYLIGHHGTLKKPNWFSTYPVIVWSHFRHMLCDLIPLWIFDTFGISAKPNANQSWCNKKFYQMYHPIRFWDLNGSTGRRIAHILVCSSRLIIIMRRLKYVPQLNTALISWG